MGPFIWFQQTAFFERNLCKYNCNKTCPNYVESLVQNNGFIFSITSKKESKKTVSLINICFKTELLAGLLELLQILCL